MQTRFDLQSITTNSVTTGQSLLYEAYFTWADPEVFVREVSNFDVFVVVFLVDEGWEDPNTTISGPSSACQ